MEEKRIQASLQELLEDEKLAGDGMLPTELAKPKGVRSSQRSQCTCTCLSKMITVL